MPTTLVTGATGFLAGHCVDQLLKAGHNVIGTVRNPAKAERLTQALQSSVDSGKLTLETVKDIQNEAEFEALFKKHPKLDYILHTASPFNFTAEDPEEEMLKPAIQGTLSVLKTAKAHAPNVKKIVITSSVASNLDVATFYDPNTTYTEKSWNPMTWEQAAEKGNPFANYMGSKLYAEKAGIEFRDKEKPQFSITWINPTYILGPGVALDMSALNTSNEVLANVLGSKKGQDPEGVAGWFVDVRDCARAHVVALKPELDGERLLLATAKFCTQDIEDIANKIPEFHGKIAIGNPANREKELNHASQCDASYSKKLLDIDWIPFNKTVEDFANQWYEQHK
ncbi:YALI0C20251p [Yarrowia lipolytica CLIB122]|jgi:NADPH-dependent methylglyoxal reductase|uniref:YALI0C20251p n=3 Tax=Yarrowia lipolytica TaxID=4952 RepID=Q6CBB9_YARLI|nr:YALI0C20251p [Yarrowia lipolytica CLIB122]AOW03150.1 hypothetical protein YALI1_C28263g [Yarrowia lipolytica]KAJ8053656.1 hypothetical protein LXG23DRAFT_23531 [Yarrowia lipolytica]QNP96112.1 Putative NADPH-dependent methylglyoxal reductase GRP2 [Yarrowia lipolytica]CAG82363.1 YALI0C20251p [Yarrowia lipolytica CLIB122]SEI33869.1 YALIA101S04e04368g1_1 [Yarrowia lipolytica]|eukprot:XP_502043.1 YALI0C20251p [Yarrowia lipolytica CLIB122]